MTAGDENGFASTFYAGRIHRNAFLNSLDVNFLSNVNIERDIASPCGVGNVYSFENEVLIEAQDSNWLQEHVGKKYCFSFWVNAYKACQLSILQNGHIVGTVQIPYAMTHGWVRRHVSFEIYDSNNVSEPLQFGIAPTFSTIEDDDNDSDKALVYFSAPQLEEGDSVTQYQPTDEIVKFSEDYGAWFNRGGIGGTIQNPLLQLNFDGAGSIGTRTKSFLLRVDGSGYLANMNINWDSDGAVTFGENVTLSWQNLDSSVRKEIAAKSVKILGGDTFTLMGDESSATTDFSPKTITLTEEETNLTSTSSQRQWYYLKNNEWVKIRGANAKTYIVYPDSVAFADASAATFKIVLTIGAKTYSDTFTIRKQHIVGYTITLTSEKGMSFKNNQCMTKLRADVYYQGKLVDPEFVKDKFTFVWKKFHLPDIDNEISGWWEEQRDANGSVIQNAIDRTQQEITLGYAITGSDLFTCELQTGSSVFPYVFPLIF